MVSKLSVALATAVFALTNLGATKAEIVTFDISETFATGGSAGTQLSGTTRSPANVPGFCLSDVGCGAKPKWADPLAHVRLRGTAEEI
jgi:hypothetical protein